MVYLRDNEYQIITLWFGSLILMNIVCWKVWIINQFIEKLDYPKTNINKFNCLYNLENKYLTLKTINISKPIK
jgi:hypothetical protein